MSEKKRGLGRGLGALIPTAPVKDAPAPAPSGPSPVDVLIPAKVAVPAAEGTPVSDGAPAASGVLSTANGSTVDDASAPGEATTGNDASNPVPAPNGDAPDAAPAPIDGAYFAELPRDSITPNPRQPREVFDEEAMAELVHSVREIGLLQPIVVRPVGNDRFELIMGERRWRAAGEAGLTMIPAIVRATGDDVMLRDALLENLHRAQLNPLEEAAAYDQLLADFGCTHDELAGRIGRSRPQISNTLRLLKLPPSVQRRVAAGVLSAGHARAVLGLADSAAQERLAPRIVAEGLSVRTVEEIVALGGDEAKPARARRANKPVAPKLEVLANRLADRFETRVKVDLGRSKGRIVVEFGSIDDLERIVALMTVDGERAAGDSSTP
ncbi:MAG: ParB/RepB/Spo0J family partition protein [Actinomycetes bacterium]